MIVCLITATINGSYIVRGASIKCCICIFRILSRIDIHCLIYIHLHMTFRSTIKVITTEYLTACKYAIVTFCSLFSSKGNIQFGTVKQYVDITTNEGLYFFYSRLISFCPWFANSSRSLTTQSATKDVTVNCTSIEVHIRYLIGIKFHWGAARLAGTGITQCGTAIDIAINNRISGIVRTIQCTYIHCDTAIHQCRFAQTTTEYNIGQRIRSFFTPVGAYCSSSKCHLGITNDASSSITTAIDAL